MNWVTSNSTGSDNNYILTNSTTTDTLTFDIPETAATMWAGYFKSDWLPESCKREKYLPTWHLVRSYGC